MKTSTVCRNCKTSWHVYFVQEELADIAGLTYEERRDFHALPLAERLTEHFRAVFGTVGWQFAETMEIILRCPACPRDENIVLETFDEFPIDDPEDELFIQSIMDDDLDS